MTRLPVPGSDDGTWGDILNEFLSIEHNADGSQKALPQSKITNLATDLAAKVVKNTLYYNVRDYGATGNGTTDDTAAFNSAISALLATTTGGTVFIPSGQYRIAGNVYFPPASGSQSLDMVGAGTFASTLTLDGVSAQITFSQGGGNAATGLYGGSSGNFRLLGINGAKTALFVGLGAQRTFHDIFIDGFEKGLVLDQLQNSRFNNISIYNCTVDGLVLDHGAGGNCFYGLEVSGHSNIGIRFTASSIGAGYTGPTDNKFFGGIIEWQYVGTAPVAHIHYGAGEQNYIYGMHIANSGTGAGQHTAAIRIRVDNAGAAPSSLHLNGVWATGTSGHGYFIDAIDDGYKTFVDECALADFDCLWKLSDNHSIEVGSYTYQSVTQRFRNQSGGANFEENLVRQRRNHPLEYTAAAGGQNIEVTGIDGQAGLRFRRTSDGVFVWCNPLVPDWTGDTTLYRGGANQLKTDDRFVAIDGITTKTKAGIPTDTDFATTPSDGTLVIDTTNSKIYVRIGGVWKSVAVA